MIELFDAQRLLPRRDHTLLIAHSALALCVGLMVVQGLTLQHQLKQTRGQSLAMKTLGDKRSASQASLKSVSPELLADLRRQAERLEAEVSPSASSEASRMPPSQWLGSLDELGTADVSVVKAEVARDGTAALEGLALSTKGITAYLSAFDRHTGFASLQARALELKEDKDRSGLLRFVLRTVPNESVPHTRATGRAASGQTALEQTPMPAPTSAPPMATAAKGTAP